MVKAPDWLFPADPAVQRELFMLGYRNLAASSVLRVLLPALVAWGVWSTAPPASLAIWFGLMVVLCLAALLTLRVFRKEAALPQPGAATLKRWRVVHLFMLVGVGLSWGSASFLFVPGAHIHNLVLVTAFCGVLAAGAMTSGPSDFFGYQTASFLGILLVMAQLQSAFGDQAVVLQATFVLYFVVLFMSSRNVRMILVQAIQLRLANAALAQQNAATALVAEKANRDKSEFLASASHDLRQPVHALLLLVEAYRQQTPGAADHPLLNHIASAGQSINSLFNALMELSRLESGTEKLAPTTFDLNDAIARALNRVKLDAERKGLALRSRVARGPAFAPLWLTLHTDRLLLERVLTNLLSNAVRYTPEGGVLLALRPAHGGKGDEGGEGGNGDEGDEGDEGGLWLEVWDTGIGIDAAGLTRIFDPYVQIGNAERDRAKGLGLGLAITAHATQLLGLKLSVHSRPGRGSCFRLHLPAAMCRPQPAIAAPQADTPATVAAPQLAGRRVLLVEDDAMVLNAMQALLTGWQLDLRCANRGDVAVALGVCGPDWVPECVLCDFRLPGPLDGVALLDALFEHFPHAVGILQTGELAHSVQALARQAGYMVLSKPIEPGVLVQTLAAVLAGRSPTTAANPA